MALASWDGGVATACPLDMAIDKLLKRYFWAALLALVALAAFFDAQGIMQVVGATLGADETQLAAVPLAARLPPAPASAA
jgi:hypothetical protein